MLLSEQITLMSDQLLILVIASHPAVITCALNKTVLLS